MSLQVQTQVKAPSGPTPVFSPEPSDLLQRQCACGGLPRLDGTCRECRGKRLTLRQRPTDESAHATVPPIVHDVLRSSGQPLKPDIRAFMERRFGHDFSRVRVHTDDRAAEAARDVKALAYTVGQDVVFAAGRLTPQTSQGLRLLAHELTHTLQQQYIELPRRGIRLGPADNLHEREATQMSERVMTGNLPKSASFTSAQSSIQRACGAADIGSVSDCTGRGGDIADVGSSSEDLYLFQPSCDEFLPGEEARLQDFATRITPDDLLEIDGFASEEGSPDFNEELSCARAHKVASILFAAGVSRSQVKTLYKHGGTPGPRAERRSAVVTVSREPPVPEPREVTGGEQTLLDRLALLGRAAEREGSGGAEFGRVVDEFQGALRQRIEELHVGDPLPDDLQLIMKALMLWSADPGNRWGEGIWDSGDLVLSAPDYATVPAGQYKCNAYVAEVVYQSLRIVQRVYESEEEPGKYFPYRASEWGDANLAIPHFIVVSDPRMGDIWSNGSHTGIFLGSYAGRLLYISARDDGDGVFGLEAELQREHGIQIKYLPEGGVYRRYTP